MKINYNMFFEKYSDLDNMLPVLCGLLDADEDVLGRVIYYGNGLTNDSRLLLNYCMEKYRGRLKYYHAGVFCVRKQNLDDIFSAILKGKISRKLYKILSKVNAFKKHAAVKKAFHAAGIIDASLCSSEGEVLFFGFPAKRFIPELLKRLDSHRCFCVRLPQGVHMTISAFNKVNNCLTPLGSNDYAPDWADLAINSDFFRSNYRNYICSLFGMETYKKPPNYIALGSVRYSAEWINFLDEAFSKVESKFSEMRGTRKNILFLLTPAEKNVWWDELERIIDIIISYDVNLVVKHFHGRKEKIIRYADNFRMDEKAPTSVLIRDADAVFYIATSSVLDAYMRRKEILQLSYIYGNMTILEKFDFGLRANSRDDVHVYLKKFTDTGRLCDGEDSERKLSAEEFVEKNIVGSHPGDLYVKEIKKRALGYLKNSVRFYPCSDVSKFNV